MWRVFCLYFLHYGLLLSFLSCTGLWGVLNNAGISGRCGPPEWMRIKDYRQVIYVTCHIVCDLCSGVTLSVPWMALVLLVKGFSVSAPSLCNSLSYNCRSAELLSTFKRNLKTELFVIAYTVNVNTQHIVSAIMRLWYICGTWRCIK